MQWKFSRYHVYFWLEEKNRFTISRIYYSVWFICWVSPYNCDGSVANPSILKESFTWIVRWMHFFRGENVEVWRIDCRPWGVGDDRSIGNAQCERGDIFQTRRICFFQSQMDESKLLEKIRNWEHPFWYGIDQFKERVTLTLLENQKGLFHNFMIHFRMPVKVWTIFGPCREVSYTAITLNSELN